MPDEAERVEKLKEMLARNPEDARIRFALALEYEKLERWQDAVDELERYLDATDDQGNAWGRLGGALRRLGRDEEARTAYRTGVDAAIRYGHPSMAAEYEAILDEWDA